MDSRAATRLTARATDRMSGWRSLRFAPRGAVDAPGGEPRFGTPRDGGQGALKAVCDRSCGFATPQFVLAAGLALMFFVFLANMIVFQYGKGVVRGALNEGVRAGARSAAGLGDCERALTDTLDDLLGGTMGEGVEAWCSADGAFVRADANVTFRSWIPGVPDWSFTVSAQSVKESVP